MPFVDFICDCGEKENDVYFKRPGEFKHKCKCGLDMKRKYSPTPFKFEFFYGWDVGLGKYVDTRKDRENTMREIGVHKRD